MTFLTILAEVAFVENRLVGNYQGIAGRGVTGERRGAPGEKEAGRGVLCAGMTETGIAGPETATEIVPEIEIEREKGTEIETEIGQKTEREIGRGETKTVTKGLHPESLALLSL